MPTKHPPPSNRGRGFPFSMQSDSMKVFFTRVKKTIQPKRVAIIRNGHRNSLEQDGFIQALRAQLNIDDEDCKVLSTRSPSFLTIIDDEPELLVYPNGDANIPPFVQAGLVGNSFRHTRVIAFTTKGVMELVAAKQWSPEFARLVNTEVAWPSWSERVEDRGGVVSEIYKRLIMPVGRERPRLSDDVVRLLIETPTHEIRETDNPLSAVWSPTGGVNDIENLLKAAWSRYIAGNCRGPLTPSHLFPERQPKPRRNELRSEPPGSG